jgi:hypothetical protein
MKRQTRTLLLNLATGIALAMTAAVVLTPTMTMAAPATATTNANVRAAPSTSARVIGVLQRGDVVDADCGGGWCELADGGFVSSSLLAIGGGRGRPDVGVGISVGPGGISIGVGTPGRPGRPGPIVIGDGEVCFFERTRSRGDSFCMDEGDSIRNLQTTGWNDEISSIRNRDGLRVTVCFDAGYSDCRTYTSSANSLGDFDDEISSIRVR